MFPKDRKPLLPLALTFLCLTVFSVLVYSATLNAQPSCHNSTNPVLRDFEGLSSYLHDVAVYGTTDRRHTVADFAKNVSHEPVSVIDRRYAATGKIICGEWEGSAQLTGSSDVITTANHLLEDAKTCQKLAEPQQCRFIIQTSEGATTYYVSSLVASGFKCPAHPSPDLDWAVMKLNKKVPGIKPYRISQKDVARMKDGDQVVNVCHSADFKPRLNTPKHIGFCSIKKVYRMPNPIFVNTDCDGGGYCSGGSLLNGNEDDPALLAIHKGSFETQDEERWAIKRGTVNKRTYDEMSWSAGYVPIQGQFLDAIVRASETNPIRERDENKEHPTPAPQKRQNSHDRDQGVDI